MSRDCKSKNKKPTKNYKKPLKVVIDEMQRDIKRNKKTTFAHTDLINDLESKSRVAMIISVIGVLLAIIALVGVCI